MTIGAEGSVIYKIRQAEPLYRLAVVKPPLRELSVCVVDRYALPTRLVAPIRHPFTTQTDSSRNIVN